MKGDVLTMDGKDVKPKKWGNIKVLYDDGETSIIYGVYDNKKKCIAIRWNKDPNEPGFPKQGKYPTWFVFPDWLFGPVLHILKTKKGINITYIDEAIQKLDIKK